MQSYNVVNPGGPKGWFPRNRWIIILTVVAVVIICVPIFCENFRDIFIRTSPPPLTFDPMTGVTVDDSTGNRDGEINPGEQLKVRLRLTNAGDQPISGFDMVLSTQDIGVKVIDDTLHYSVIGTGDTNTVWSKDTFEFKLDSNFVSECVVFTGRIENATLAGLIGDAFAQSQSSGNQIVIPLSVISNYRLCVGACKLQQAANPSDPDILTLDLRLCNASGAVLSLPSMRIDSVKIKKCDTPSTSFNVVRVVATGGTRVGLDSLLFTSNLQNMECRRPNDPTTTTPGTGIFQFKAVLPPLVGTICVDFTVLIYENHTTLVGRSFIGTEAMVLP